MEHIVPFCSFCATTVVFFCSKGHTQWTSPVLIYLLLTNTSHNPTTKYPFKVDAAIQIKAATFPFDVAVAHLELGGGVGGAPGLVQHCVVEAGVAPAPGVFFLPLLLLLIIITWAIGEDVCSCSNNRHVSKPLSSKTHSTEIILLILFNWPTSFLVLHRELVWCICEQTQHFSACCCLQHGFWQTVRQRLPESERSAAAGASSVHTWDFPSPAAQQRKRCQAWLAPRSPQIKTNLARLLYLRVNMITAGSDLCSFYNFQITNKGNSVFWIFSSFFWGLMTERVRDKIRTIINALL